MIQRLGGLATVLIAIVFGHLLMMTSDAHAADCPDSGTHGPAAMDVEADIHQLSHTCSTGTIDCFVAIESASPDSTPRPVQPDALASDVHDDITNHAALATQPPPNPPPRVRRALLQVYRM